jgi:beta-glucosidase
VEGYKDTNKPIEERVTDLLSRMTLEEKVAQLQSVWGYDVMDNRSTFNPDKAAKRLADGIGQITRHGNATQLMPREVAAFADKVQRFLVENTRLGIPAIMHEECLCGYQARTATIFPQAIGQAATWDPEIIRRMTEAIRAQLRAVGAHQGLAPVLDIAREPRWGRCEETYAARPISRACRAAIQRGELWRQPNISPATPSAKAALTGRPRTWASASSARSAFSLSR